MKNEILNQTDYWIMPDFQETLDEDQKSELREYRSYLRNFMD